MILSIIFGFIFGIFLGSVISVTLSKLLILIFICSLFAVSFFIVPPPHRRIIFLGILFFVSAILGLGRIYFSPAYTHSKLEAFSSKQVFIKGIIVDEPDVRDAGVKLAVRTESVTFSSTTANVQENILISASLYPEFHYGDMVSFKTVLLRPKAFDSEGRVFDYEKYLRVREVWYVGTFTSIKLISSGHGAGIKNFLFKAKHAFTDSLERALPQPEASLLAGLLLGSKRSLGKDLLLDFSHAGVSHVVVLSGYNIAIVAESIMAALSFLPGTLSFAFGCVGIILFTLMSGGGASAVRALLMVLVALFAKHTGREYYASRAFGFAVLVMLLWNPLLLVFDPSFELSILATIGLIFVSPFVTPYLGWITEKYGLREIISSTLATQVTVLPFLVYSNGIFSLVSLPVNILILGTIPLTMFFGFLTGMLGFISVYLSYIPALPSYVLLWYQLAVVHFSSQLSFGWFTLPPFSVWMLVVIYFLIICGFYFFHNKNPKV